MFTTETGWEDITTLYALTTDILIDTTINMFQKCITRMKTADFLFTKGTDTNKKLPL